MHSAAALDLGVDAVLVGRAQAFTRPGSRSAIAKRPLPGRLRIGIDGLELDEQGDRRVHGGPDKALHHYPRDHYAAWRQELGAHALLEASGAFGENLSTLGATEADLCLGDRLRLGTALVEVSQSRQPCWKLSDRFGVATLARRVQESGRTGWYYRVLQPGEVAAGDRLTLLERPYPDWSLARLIQLLYRREVDPAQLEQVLELPLVPNWRVLFERRLAQREVECWDKRLLGQPAAE
ncbi:MOSC domain-containing protein [Xanthomonas bonasiae]|uniref:MOSC domain-containing protein n=1 Tax=Xanthomonas bonasiae TaxID=2810351 RepID=UPI00177F9B36|nr:MOSC domain-containing protein [Xanthomonas surreyensis]MBD7924300.1 MOSC domain-containing protein [Xanthomonas surreyensis]